MMSGMSTGIEGDLDEFFTFAGGMSDITLREVASAWHEMETDPRRTSAAERGRDIVRAQGRKSVLDDAFNDLRTWLNQRTGAGAGIFGVTSQDRIEAAGQALPAFVDALVAILAADQLTDDEHDILVRPLRRIVGAEPEESGRG
jgi:hypothetical protein